MVTPPCPGLTFHQTAARELITMQISIMTALLYLTKVLRFLYRNKLCTYFLPKTYEVAILKFYKLLLYFYILTSQNCAVTNAGIGEKSRNQNRWTCIMRSVIMAAVQHVTSVRHLGYPLDSSYRNSKLNAA
jgi:hypothetical protein